MDISTHYFTFCVLKIQIDKTKIFGFWAPVIIFSGDPGKIKDFCQKKILEIQVTSFFPSKKSGNPTPSMGGG